MGLMAHQIRPIVKEWEKTRGLLAFEVSNKQYPSLPIKFWTNRTIKFSNQADGDEIVSFSPDEAAVKSRGSVAPVGFPNITPTTQPLPSSWDRGEWHPLCIYIYKNESYHTYSLRSETCFVLYQHPLLYKSPLMDTRVVLTWELLRISLFLLFLTCLMISLW